MTTAGACLLRVFGKLEGLQKAVGVEGDIRWKAFEGGANGIGEGFKVFLREDGGAWDAFPCSMSPTFA